MSRESLLSRLLLNLRGSLSDEMMGYMPREEAVATLRQLSGQDFGYDAEQWQAWFNDHPEIFPGFDIRGPR